MPRSRPPVLAQERFRQHASQLSALELSDKFRYIYRTNMWGSAESVSGVGSTFHATASVREGIAEICRHFAVRNLVDVPCGDASWIAISELPVESYIGLDIVPELIVQNSELRSRPGMEFRVADMTRDKLPQCDLVLCRDCLVHLSFENIQRALSNIKGSGSKFLLTTTFVEHDLNCDIDDGDWRLLNLEKSPFCFPPPIVTINEQCTEIAGAYQDKSLALWEIGLLPIEANVANIERE
jgi:hypothetical protein